MSITSCVCDRVPVSDPGVYSGISIDVIWAFHRLRTINVMCWVPVLGAGAVWVLGAGAVWVLANCASFRKNIVKPPVCWCFWCFSCRRRAPTLYQKRRVLSIPPLANDLSKLRQLAYIRRLYRTRTRDRLDPCARTYGRSCIMHRLQHPARGAQKHPDRHPDRWVLCDLFFAY